MKEPRDQAIFLRVSALLLAVIGFGALLLGLVVGLSAVYGPPDVPSSSGERSIGLDCGTPFSPKDQLSGLTDGSGNSLTSYGEKLCQSVMGAAPHIAAALVCFGVILLLVGVAFVVQIVHPRREVLDDRGAHVEPPPDSVSIRRIDGGSVTVAVVGSQPYLRVKDVAAVLGTTEDALTSMMPEHARPRINVFGEPDPAGCVFLTPRAVAEIALTYPGPSSTALSALTAELAPTASNNAWRWQPPMPSTPAVRSSPAPPPPAA